METQDAQVSYTTHSELPPPTTDLAVLVEMLQSEDWRMSFLGLDQLRSHIKFQWSDFCMNFQDLYPIVTELTDSPRSSLSKNSLLTISECFQTPAPESDELISAFLPSLLSKSMNEKAFIKAVAREGLKNVSQSCVNVHTAEALAAYCHNKSGGISDLSFRTLQPILEEIPPENALALSLGLLSSKRGSVITGTRNFVNKLKESWPDFESHLVSLAECDRKTLSSVSSKQGFQQSASLRDFISQKRFNGGLKHSVTKVNS